ncbi:DNA polymerase III subunit alpha, partial [Paenibacillus solisilvae]
GGPAAARPAAPSAVAPQASGAAGAARPAPAAGPRSSAAAAAAPPVKAAVQGKRQQRLYVKLAAGRDKPAALEQLKSLLAGSAGALETVLFYESEQKTVVLSDAYRIKPSPQLLVQIETIFGKGSAVVK